ncbi:MAG: hypothetical protein AAF436_18285 [Myxococcota bacterium]
MISEDFAFFGFDDTAWDRLASLLLGERENEPHPARGVLVVVVARGAGPVAAFHTALGSVDPATLPSLDDLEAFCEATEVGACLIVRPGAMTDFADYLSEPLNPTDDFVTRVMRFAHVSRELGGGALLGVWPNPLPEVLLPAAPAAKPAGELLLPDGHCAVLGVFDQGELWTAAVLRRQDGLVDTLAGPRAIEQWTGPLGGDWRRDHRVVIRSVEREVGPVHVGLFMERPTSQALFVERQTGAWALSFASRSLLVHPMPGFAAAALGINGVAGLAVAAFQAIEEMDPDEVAHIAAGFWHGLTDGQGLSGLLGFSPVEVVANAWQERVGGRSEDDTAPAAPETREPADSEATPPETDD